MPRFNLGLFQKNFNSTSRVTGPAINMGCTRGRGSTTRMFNYCNQRSPNPSTCINQFITVNNNESYLPPNPHVPAVPGAPTITSITSGFISLSVNFTPPNDGGSPIIDYEYSIDGGNTYQSSGLTSSPILINNLTPNQSYTIYIKAINNIGTGPASNPSSNTALNIGPLGKGFQAPVRSIIPYLGINSLYVGGNFSDNGDFTETFNRLAIWDKPNNTWSKNINSDGGIGLQGGPVYQIIEIPFANNLYVAGYFTNASSSTYLQSIGIFNTDTNQWSSLGNTGSGAGVVNNFSNPGGECLAYNLFNNYIYFGGSFTKTAMGTTLNYISYININDPSQYKAIQQISVNSFIGLNAPVRCITVDNNNDIFNTNYGKVYIGGDFTGNGSITLNRIASYNPNLNSWSSLGDGLNERVYAISIPITNPTLLYVGGNFTGTTTGQTLNYVAQYNTAFGVWSPIGNLSSNYGPNGKIYAIAVANNGDVYVGGSFSVLYIDNPNFPGNPLGVSCYNIAKFSTATNRWSVIPGPTSDVYKIYIDETDEIIYVGGDFTNVNNGINTIPANCIYRYKP